MLNPHAAYKELGRARDLAEPINTQDADNPPCLEEDQWPPPDRGGRGQLKDIRHRTEG